jgi:hypothetical protein
MIVDLIFNNVTTGKIGNLSLDVTLRDQVTFRNEVTEFPIEDGSVITDNVIRKPDNITIEGKVSDSPLMMNLKEGVTAYTDSFSSGQLGKNLLNTGSRTEQALTELLRIVGRPYPIGVNSPISRTVVPVVVTVVTGLLVYNNMVVTSLTIPRDAKTGRALSFSIELTNIKKVTASRVTIDHPISQTVGTIKTTVPKTRSVGKVTPTTVKPRVSLLAGMFNRLATGR